MNTEKLNIGENIQKYRKLRNYKQSDLSEKAKVPTNNISRYENNKVVPSIDVLMKLASALDVTLGELTGEITVLENELELKNTITISEFYKENYTENENLMKSIKEKISLSSDPDKLKKLFSEYEEYKTIYLYYFDEHMRIEKKIQDLCELLNVSRSDFANNCIIDKDSTRYINCLESINSMMNDMMKEEFRNRNKISEQIISGDLEYYKKLFSLEDLSFFYDITDLVLSLYLGLKEGESENWCLIMFYASISKVFANKKIDLALDDNQIWRRYCKIFTE